VFLIEMFNFRGEFTNVLGAKKLSVVIVNNGLINLHIDMAYVC